MTPQTCSIPMLSWRTGSSCALTSQGMPQVTYLHCMHNIATNNQRTEPTTAAQTHEHLPLPCISLQCMWQCA